MIPQATIDRILDTANIEEVVADYVELRRQGTTYKCCCPFHEERTPSFTVFPRTKTYKCFGCGEGGNAISFLMRSQNMDFPAAVRTLARKYGIEVEEKEEGERERTDRMRRESLFVALDFVARAYREEFKKSKEARDYAFARWGEEFCTRMGLGYAPREGGLVSRLPLNHDHLQALGLINENHNDFFRHRLVIPITDRYSRVIGFTCRRLDGEKECKYLNSRASEIYDKGRSLFGIEWAWTAAVKARRLYLVEGAPDCMRLQSIGVLNAVADLGTAWTDDQLALVKRMAPTVCFIPDGDVPKDGQPYGAGTAAVLRAGKHAMQCGLDVMVKEIPNGTGQKQDPDTYFKDRLTFDHTREQDFVTWFADKAFERAYSATEKTEAMKEVAGVMLLVEDATRRQMYIDELQVYYKGKRTWKEAMDGERKAQELERSRKARRQEADADEMDLQYGFHIERGKYFSVTDSGSVYEWSNFTLTPMYLIQDNDRPQRMFKMCNEFQQEVLVVLDPADLVSLQQFCIKVESFGNFLWKASQKELTKLKSYLFRNTENATPIKQLGWQRDGFFAFGNGIADNGVFHGTDDYGIVRLGRRGIFYIAANTKQNRLDNKHFSFQHQFVHDTHSSISLHDYTSQLFTVYGDNGREAFAFLLATLFRDIVIRETRSFPILNLFGPKGSGKSDLAQTIMAFFIRASKGSDLTNTSMAALGETVAAVSNACVHLEEYKNDIDIRKIAFLKNLWDGIGRSRMNMDRSGSKEMTAVDSGIILSGQEMPTADIALFSRVIHLTFPTSEFTFDEKQRHKALMAVVQQGLTHLTIEILREREHFEKFFPSMYDNTSAEVAKRLENLQIEARTLNNWVTTLAVFRTLEMRLDVPMTAQDLMAITIEGIKRQNAETKTSSELGAFWKIVAYLVGEGELIEGADYRVVYRRRLKTKSGDVFDWSDTHPVLLLQKTRIFMLYKIKERQAGDNAIPEESLRYYLEKSRPYLGEKNVRYDVYQKGQPVYDRDKTDAHGHPAIKTTVAFSYCFDYQILRHMYGINLEKSAADAADEDEDAPREPTQQDIPF